MAFDAISLPPFNMEMKYIYIYGDARNHERNSHENETLYKPTPDNTYGSKSQPNGQFTLCLFTTETSDQNAETSTECTSLEVRMVSCWSIKMVLILYIIVYIYNRKFSLLFTMKFTNENKYWHERSKRSHFKQTPEHEVLYFLPKNDWQKTYNFMFDDRIKRDDLNKQGCPAELKYTLPTMNRRKNKLFSEHEDYPTSTIKNQLPLVTIYRDVVRSPIWLHKI
jgi:hypothetical protein